MIHNGTLRSEHQRHASRYHAFTAVIGDLHVDAKADLRSLNTITRDLWLGNAADVRAPKPKHVGGELGINIGTKISMPELETVDGYLLVNGNNVTLNDLKCIGGNLFIFRNFTLNAARLETVGGLLYLHPGAVLNAPKLVSRRIATELNLTVAPL